MTWPRTLGDLFHLAGLVASVAQGVVFVLLALLLIAFVWWVFQVARHPDATVYGAMRAVLVVALLAVLTLAFIPFIRWIRQLTG
jgi:hypothetical protein